MMQASPLHSDKVALVTGASEGIGKQIARKLALEGAKVALCSRNAEKLQATCQAIAAELKEAGITNPSERLLPIADCEVADDQARARAIAETLARFGRIDYLINNAGATGAEKLLVDMPAEDWEKTLETNLISNYDLILRALPGMKAQGQGHILNMSSYIGGAPHATIAYPTRSDYAVSKAGQRALAESLALLLGPEVQINAMAPGPVEGTRLLGDQANPGVYQRRARGLFENKRLGLVYQTVLSIQEAGSSIESALKLIARNGLSSIMESPECPNELLGLTRFLSRREPSTDRRAGADQFLLTRALAQRLLDRLRRGGQLSPDFTDEHFFEEFTDAPEPFFSDRQVAALEEKIRRDVLRSLPLARMATEEDISREVSFTLANRNITGETLHPSCGLHPDRITVSGDFVGRAHPDLMTELSDQLIVLCGDSMYKEMAVLASLFVENSRSTAGFKTPGVRQVCIMVGSQTGLRQVQAALEAHGIPPNRHFASKIRLEYQDPRGIGRGIDRAIEAFGPPNVIISFPMGTIRAANGANVANTADSNDRQPWQTLPATENFRALIRDQITCHWRVVQRASLIDNVRVVFVTPQAEHRPGAPSPEAASAMVDFVRATLRPLTVTAGQEGARMPAHPTFNQVDLTEGGNLAPTETDRELSTLRFLETILLMSLPPDAGEPRLDVRRAHPGTTITF